MVNTLIADHDAGIRRLLELVLSSEGHHVIEAESGKHALSYLQTNSPDLIILESDLPDIDGIDICYRVKRVSRLKQIPILILTSSDDERTKQNARLANADAVLAKPLSGKGLRGTVDRLLAVNAATEPTAPHHNENVFAPRASAA